MSASERSLGVERRRGAVPRGAAGARRAIPAVHLVGAIDVGLLLIALLVVLVAGNVRRMPQGLDEFLSIRVTLKNLMLLAGFGVSAVGLFRVLGLYDAAVVRRWPDEMRRLAGAVAGLALVAAVFPLTSRSGAFPTSALLRFALLAFAALAAFRAVRAALVGGRGERQRVLIVGSGPQALRIHRELCADVSGLCQVLGFVDTTPVAASPFVVRRTLGPLEALEGLLVHEHVDEVYVGLPIRSHYRQIQETLRVCERVGVQARYRADLFESEIARPLVEASGAAGLVRMQVAPEGGCLKRGLDLVGAVVAIVVFSPIMLGAALAIKATGPGPVIYAQERYGLNRRRFRMFKFRTMVSDADRLQAALESRNEADGPVFKISDDPRVTRVGRWLRRTSIDELPQLFNVLRGEMSLVGPRPLPLRDVARITRPSHMRRFSVRPGLTCLWQVSGRSGIGFEEWVRLDLMYIDRWSLGLDVSILARTVPAVLRGTGAH